MDLSPNRRKSTSWNIALYNALYFFSDPQLSTSAPQRDCYSHEIDNFPLIANKRIHFKNIFWGLFYFSIHLRII